MDIEVIAIITSILFLILTIIITIKSRKVADEIRANVRRKAQEGSPRQKTLRAKDEKLKILIVEDDAFQRINLEDTLHSMDTNYEIVSASDKEIALKMLEKETFSLFLLDIGLPDSEEGGLEIARIIREQYQIPFIFITSHDSKEENEKIWDTEPAGYIHKPYLEKQLKVSVNNALIPVT